MTEVHRQLDPRFDAGDVLAHTGWVRELARSLLRSDPALADDLAQEACLAALDRPSPGCGSLRAWLAGAVRNLVRQHRRGEGRRRARESVVAREERQPSALELVERLALHRQVVEAVASLEEPYRTVVLERFFEGRSVRAIARSQGVPLATVKTRLARALARLRAALEREHGEGGHAWAFALLPLVRGSAESGTSLGGILVMSMQVKLALAAAVVCGGALWFWSSERAGPDVPGARLPVALMAIDVPAASEALPSSALRVDAAAVPALARRTPLGAAPTSLAPALVHGRVLDCAGAPVAGVRVWFEPGRESSSPELVLPATVPPSDTPSIASDARGRFDFEAPIVAGRFLAFESRYATVLSALWRPGSESEPVVLVVAPSAAYSGRVVADDARALAGARVVLLLPRELRAGIADALDGSAECGWVARSDEQGVFALSGVPLVDGVRLTASLEGWLGELVDAPPSSSRHLEIVMHRPEVGAGALSGQVSDRAGWPVEEALVSLGQRTTTTDRRGLFSLEVPALDVEGSSPFSRSSTNPGRRCASGVSGCPMVVRKLSDPGVSISATGAADGAPESVSSSARDPVDPA